MSGYRSSRTRSLDFALLLLVAVALAGSAVLLWPRHPAAEHDRASVVTAPHKPTMLFIGDSYAGNADPGETSYGCIAAVEMGWRCELAALPGTGYFSGGSANRFVSNTYTGEQSTSFAERITELRTVYRPDVVVLDGGRNDGLLPPQELLQTMTYTIGLVHETWPDAQVVVVRPRFLDNASADLGLDDALIAQLNADPQAQGVTVVDPIGTVAAQNPDPADLLIDDGVHPNSSGAQELAAALVAELEARGLGGAT
ncbi:MAG TPA: SGNH/GDSL hydrolase family protein [Mycobacterium sp.]